MRHQAMIHLLLFANILFLTSVTPLPAPQPPYICQSNDLTKLRLTSGSIISIKGTNSTPGNAWCWAQYLPPYNAHVFTKTADIFAIGTYACHFGYSTFGSLFRIETPPQGSSYAHINLSVMNRGGGGWGSGAVNYSYLGAPDGMVRTIEFLNTPISEQPFPATLFVTLQNQPQQDSCNYLAAFKNEMSGKYLHAGPTMNAVPSDDNQEYFSIEVLNRRKPENERGNELRYENAFAITLAGTPLRGWSSTGWKMIFFGSGKDSGVQYDDYRSWGKASIAYILKYPLADQTGSYGPLKYGDRIGIMHPWSVDYVAGGFAWPQESHFSYNKRLWTRKTDNGIERIGLEESTPDTSHIFYIASPWHGFPCGEVVKANDSICLTVTKPPDTDAYASLDLKPIWFWDWYEYATPLWGNDPRTSSTGQFNSSYLTTVRDAQSGQDFIRSNYNMIRLQVVTTYGSGQASTGAMTSTNIAHPGAIITAWVMAAPKYVDIIKMIDNALTYPVNEKEVGDLRTAIKLAFQQAVKIAQIPADISVIQTSMNNAANSKIFTSNITDRDLLMGYNAMLKMLTDLVSPTATPTKTIADITDKLTKKIFALSTIPQALQASFNATVYAELTKACTIAQQTDYQTVTDLIATATAKKYITADQQRTLTNALSTITNRIRSLMINDLKAKITALKTATATTTKTVLATILQAAVDIIVLHNKLKPTPTEIIALKTYYASFNNKIYALLTNKTLINQRTKKINDATLKPQIKTILTTMSAVGFPAITATQKALITAVQKAN